MGGGGTRVRAGIGLEDLGLLAAGLYGLSVASIGSLLLNK